MLQHLRQVGVVGKFVEFFGPGVAQLSIADRATIANMCPEYGATAAFFPVDDVSIQYLEQTGERRLLVLLSTWATSWTLQTYSIKEEFESSVSEGIWSFFKIKLFRLG